MIRVIISTLLISLMMIACAHKPEPDLDFDEVSEAKTSSGKVKKTKSQTSTTTTTSSRPGIVVDTEDLKTLEKMNKAVESYVLKNEKKSFTKLCKDKRFDCFVEDKAFPKNKKKISRQVPPYASGSKMGLQGEERVQIRYEFYP